MTLHRRQVLTALGTTGPAVLAGCPRLGSNESPPETAPPLSEHTTKLVAADGDPLDGFGGSVAVAADGTTALVGASHDDDSNGEDGGAAYVYERADGAWPQQAKLAAADGDSEDFFGDSVAMAADGTTALVGAPHDEDPNGEEAGAAYVFNAAGGSWPQQAKLVPADGDLFDRVGGSVAVVADGTTALVAADNDEDPNGEEAGAAYVFERAGGSWPQQAKLAAADGDPKDGFGRSVAMAADGTTAFVGAFDDEPNGAAYVFKRAGGSWPQQAKLAAADSDSHDQFGRSVAVAADGTTALIGAPVDEDPNGEVAGSAYVFERSGEDWSQQAKLVAADGDSRDFFGGSVAVAANGTTALVGAPVDEDPNGEEAGAVYVFERTGEDWSQQAKLAPADGDEDDQFGASVAMAADGTTALAGAPFERDLNARMGGAAYVFEQSGGAWPQ